MEIHFRVVAIHSPGTEDEKKRYPEEKYAKTDV